METQFSTQETGALRVSAFCAQYGISRVKLWRERRAGRIQARNSGKTVLIPVAEAERWLASLPA
jgi:hypothetical protein